MPDGAESWTVVNAVGEPVPPVEGYLAHLQALDRSPTTVRAYATSLKLWTEFLGGLGARWDEARAEHVSAVFSFYDYHARNGVELAQALVAWRRSNRGGYKPFLHHVTAGRPVATRPLRLRQPRRLPRTLTAEQVATLAQACAHLRDRFLVVLLAETGMRIGQALGLRHADFISHRRELRIVARCDNANGARAKTIEDATIPVSAGLVRLYTAYMLEEYGDLDSDYVFVNLFAEPYGRPLRYQAVASLVGRLRARTGIDFTPHMLRHTHATDLLRQGVAVDVVAKLLTHRSSTTTSQTYIHLDVGDLRTELERCGVWEKEVSP